MARKPRLHFMPVGDTDPFTPSRERPVRVRARSMPVDSHFEPHAHAWAQLAYCASGIVQVTAGQSRHKADEVAYIVPPSRAVWIAPGARHHITVLEAAEFRTLYIDASATPEGWHGCRVIVVSALLRETIRALDAIGPHASLPPEGAHFSLGRPGGKTGPLNPQREQLLTRLVLDELLHADTQVLGVPLPNAQTGDKRLRALCEAVLRAPSERATLAEWAGNIGASERTVARLFRDELGLSYQQWRQQAVLAHALPLLARGQSVSQVAAASGYASDSAFSAMFKAAMGQSPSHFQNKNSL
ncbi:MULTISPECIES: helix-turn-helix transcriptional regulator [unclassified Polaromonas]|jgi:AraC-like DNA-binding protein|uniref:AraC family transcriptional regulator n=1 Tax=unclassified Polaromonas TaxID=2638319 RepID=UPI0025D52795|nr:MULTISPECIES: helix-turn-helix transcriptional regulator [unclassified Polaromonas]HQR99533.1 helix-turn-helix transcriptional regulator [Polaromonas sp.]HQS38633.1 helix-turn-helix transcriptional regulator [Polaromonas sp.]HQS85656.1 helix-turn-helix transcriptional regulator [Polaromonas sp.]HQT05667.1 helix-turn-helix transcriptional regulator [Polaromonas sp.]